MYALSSRVALVQTIDFFPPLVDDPFLYGQIAAANAMSDVYAMGGRPLTALNIACFPDHELPLSVLHQIIRGAMDKAKEARCLIVGGHTVRDTEIKFGLAVTGLIDPKKVFANSGARPGDLLVLTKPLGTGLITTANKQGDCPETALKAACQSMSTLNRAAADAMTSVGAHAATDITGFGLAGHAYEMAMASKITLKIFLRSLPLFPSIPELVEKEFFTRATRTNEEFVSGSLRFEGAVTATQRAVFFDAQTSGGLLIAVPARKAAALVKKAKALGARHTAVVGEVLKKERVHLIAEG